MHRNRAGGSKRQPLSSLPLVMLLFVIFYSSGTTLTYADVTTYEVKSVENLKTGQVTDTATKKTEGTVSNTGFEAFYGVSASESASVAAYEAGAEDSFQAGNTSGSGSVDFSVLEAGVYFDAAAGYFYEKKPDGTIEKKVGAQVAAGTNVTLIGVGVEGQVTWENDLAKLNAQIEANAAVIAEAAVNGELSCSSESCTAEVGFDLAAAAKADAKGSVSVEIGGVKVELIAKGEVSAGLSASGNLAFEVKNGYIYMNSKLAATLGLGAGADVTVKVDATELMKKLGFASEEALMAFLKAVESGKEYAAAMMEATKQAAVAVAEGVKDVAEDVVEGAKNVVDDTAAALSAAQDVAESFAQDVAEDLGDMADGVSSTINDLAKSIFGGDEPETPSISENYTDGNGQGTSGKDQGNDTENPSTDQDAKEVEPKDKGEKHSPGGLLSPGEFHPIPPKRSPF